MTDKEKELQEQVNKLQASIASMTSALSFGGSCRHLTDREWEQENQDKLKEWYDRDMEEDGESGYFKYICPVCFKTFYTKHECKVYCGDDCLYTAQLDRNKRKRRAERLSKRGICQCCGKVFRPKRKDALYCSNSCRQKAYRNRNR